MNGRTTLVAWSLLALSWVAAHAEELDPALREQGKTALTLFGVLTFLCIAFLTLGAVLLTVRLGRWLLRERKPRVPVVYHDLDPEAFAWTKGRPEGPEPPANKGDDADESTRSG